MQPTSLALRENNPTSESGMDTLKPIGSNQEKNHRRGWSIATWSSSGGATDEGHQNEKGGQALSATTTRNEEGTEKKDDKLDKKGKKKDGKEIVSSHLDPEKDTTDPTPFKEKPSRLAMLVDPKSLEDLEKMGGIQGLLDGLGADGTKGLLVGTEEGEKVETGEPKGGAAVVPQGAGTQFKADLEERRRVYGRNDLPERKSKSLLQLMWLAFKDKVLVGSFCS